MRYASAVLMRLVRGRCSVYLWLHRCEPMWPRQKRDETGKIVPHVVEYECANCGKVSAGVEYRPKWQLRASVRRQLAGDRQRRKSA